MRTIILQYILVLMVLLGISAWACYRIFYRKTFLPSPEQDEKNKVDPLVVEWRNRHRMAFEIFYMVLICAVVGTLTYWSIIPFFKDLPYILTGEYLYFEGQVVNEYKGSIRWTDRTSLVIESEDERLKISVQNSSIQKGDYVEVLYLPNIEEGVVTAYEKGGK